MRTFLLSILPATMLFLGVSAFAQTPSFLGLPRLRERPADGSAPVAHGKFVEDALAAQGVVGARGGEKQGARFLAMDSAKEWSRPLRGGAKDLVFVSCSLYGSVGTQLAVGGARLLITDSDVLAYGQLAVEENGKWRELGVHVPMDYHDGKILARFSVLTIRLDRAEGTWDLYHGARLVAEDLPQADAKGVQRFVLKAGEQGAMLNGLVQSDENPLYADTNGNGIDDVFELEKKGTSPQGRGWQGDSQAAYRRLAQATAQDPAAGAFCQLADGGRGLRR